ncbi:maleylpyruvate isomerase family mycothiol-dependent enzyme [Saccharothrix violaceirubra]|uniref:Uncharacterized protein (TIGR03083 family) n=1 Tax=Saccharothrix violaceirubra TaxID=413306 RepID=A0A7W7T9D3_9PSEU|nr:maleylpyruvate isomerase N-terminal domain-containing protein [Saccharothrix violaceirubra]MBB4967695.1 uncharacterized protein (TIGR03083 family) [Saccharothrix violaceirubra]
MSGEIGYARLLDVLAAEAGALAAAVDGQRPERQVPACPGLTLGETARHVGSTYRLVTAWLRDGYQPLAWQQDPEPGQSLADYVRAGAGPLVDRLAAHRPDDPCPTWWPARGDHLFWARRLAHETTVHRMDVQGAAGRPLDPVADDVALDGVDEVLTLWLGHRLDVLTVRGTTEVVVSITAGGRTWLTRTGPGPASSWPADGTPAAGAVTGSPTAVYRWLWGRASGREVKISGDHDAIAQLWALLRLATK